MKRSDIPKQEIFDACNAFHKLGAETPDVVLANKYPVKLIMARMKQLVHQGFLDYGVSLRTAWVVSAYDPKED